FLLTRKPEGVGGLKVADEFQLVDVTSGPDERSRLAVKFRFNTAAGDRFHEITTKNRPRKIGGEDFFTHLAIVLDNEIASAPSINPPIRSEGQITGSFTPKDIDRLVGVLRSGALPATLKRLPVSENTIGPTLGADTIRAGTISVGIAFLAVLGFMLVYYR